MILRIFAFCCCLSLNTSLKASVMKQQTVNEILTQIYNSTGNYQTPMPGLEFVDSKEFIAAYLPQKNIIRLEREALAVCQTFGPDSMKAVAFLLGHELAHSYQNINRSTNYFSYDKHLYNSGKREKNADIQGALGATLAGYDVRSIISPLITRLYESYKLAGVKMEGYPSMAERQATANEVTDMVNELWHIYQTGNYLSALGRHDMAAQSYEYVKDYYIGREIYNNLGIQYAQVAMTFSGKNTAPYRYPFEIDVESRMADVRADDLNVKEQEIRQKLLKSGIFFLDKALELDAKYPSAQINRLCIQVQQGLYSKVIQTYESGRLETDLRSAGASAKEQADAKLVVAIAYALSGPTASHHLSAAQKLFQQLAQNPHPQIRQIAVFNEAVLKSAPLPPPPSKNCVHSNNFNARPDGVSLLSYFRKSGKYLDKEGFAELYWEAKSNSSVHLTRWQGGDDFIFQRFITAKYSAPGGVSVGDSAQSLLQKFQSEDYRSIPAGKKYFIHLPACRLIFLINGEESIEEWARYL